MMKRVEMAGAALVVVAAVCAMAASGASAKAPLWLTVSGALNGSSETLAFTAGKRSGSGDFKLETDGAIIECSGVLSSGSLVGGMPGTVSFANQPTFSGCEEDGAPEPGCVVKDLYADTNGEVTIGVTSRLVYTNSAETKVGELFEGSGAGKEFVTLLLTGGSCLTTKTPEGPSRIAGSVIGEISPEPGHMVTRGLLSFPETPVKRLYINGGEVSVSLKAFGAVAATEVGETEITAGGALWGVLES